MRRPAIPGLRSVGQLDEGRHLSLTDHLQQLHVQTEEEVDRLLGDSGGSDSKAVLLTVGEPESVVNLAEKQPVVLLWSRLDTDLVKYQLLGYGVSQTTVRSPALLLFVVVQGLVLGPVNNLSPQSLGVTSLALNSLLNFLEYPGYSHEPARFEMLDIL